jgi:hypothetical protein
MVGVTKQYPNMLPKEIGEFSETEDAYLFIQAKFDWDDKIKSPKAIYKTSFNLKEFQSNYQVTRQSPENIPETIAKFQIKSNANIFVQAKMESDKFKKIRKSIYTIKDDRGNVETHIWDIAQESQVAPTKHFSPTPLPNSPRPPGMPGMKRNEEDDD